MKRRWTSKSFEIFSCADILQLLTKFDTAANARARLEQKSENVFLPRSTTLSQTDLKDKSLASNFQCLTNPIDSSPFKRGRCCAFCRRPQPFFVVDDVDVDMTAKTWQRHTTRTPLEITDSSRHEFIQEHEAFKIVHLG